MEDYWWMTDLVDIIARSTREIPFLAQPVSLDLHLETALDDRIACKLG